MAEQTKGWFAVGIGLIIAGCAFYGAMVLLGIAFVIGQASTEADGPVWLVLIVPGLILLGFIVLIAKVIVDRLGNDEDDYYSKNVDR